MYSAAQLDVEEAALVVVVVDSATARARRAARENMEAFIVSLRVENNGYLKMTSLYVRVLKLSIIEAKRLDRKKTDIELRVTALGR